MKIFTLLPLLAVPMMSSVALANTSLVSCKFGPTSDAKFNIESVQPGLIKINGQLKYVLSAEEYHFDDFTGFKFETAEGEVISIQSTSDGKTIVLDRYVYGGECESKSVKKNVKALKKLVADAVPVQKYLLATCVDKSQSNYPSFTMTVRKGVVPGTAIIEGDLGDDASGSFGAVVLKKESSKDQVQTSVSYLTSGRYLYSALGLHSIESTELNLERNADSSSVKLSFGIDEIDAGTQSCVINNAWYLDSLLTK